MRRPRAEQLIERWQLTTMPTKNVGSLRPTSTKADTDGASKREGGVMRQKEFGWRSASRYSREPSRS